MRFFVLEAVDPEHRKLRLRKVADYYRRHSRLSQRSQASDSSTFYHPVIDPESFGDLTRNANRAFADRKVADAHAKRANRAYWLLTKYTHADPAIRKGVATHLIRGRAERRAARSGLKSFDYRQAKKTPKRYT